MLLLALLLQSAEADYTPPPPPLHGAPAQMTCPVGGEQFSAWLPSMYSTYGARPDGKPYSYLPLPFPLPECPTNKLLVFDEFSPKEVASLKRLVQSIDYKHLIESQTTYYRAYWLATQLGRPKPQALGLLLSAIWEVSPGEMAPAPSENGEGQLRRYQETFVREVEQLSSTVQPSDRVWLEARAANAARQMGQFSKAEALRKKAEASASRSSEQSSWKTYLGSLQTVIDREDTSVEPLDMIPPPMIASACVRRQVTNAFDRTACAKPDVADAIVKLRAAQQR